jgi:hypothetical protein
MKERTEEDRGNHVEGLRRAREEEMKGEWGRGAYVLSIQWGALLCSSFVVWADVRLL